MPIEEIETQKLNFVELDEESIKVVDVEEEDTSSGETISQPFSPSDISLSNPPMNLGDLIDMMDAGWIAYDPDYQRNQDLWSSKMQSRLIESVLLGLRLPAFYFEELSKNKWTIIDGLQRCCAIRNFCVNGTLTLSELEFLGDQFNGKKFQEFDFATRRSIRMLPITVNLLAQGVPPAVKYVLFKRLNTGGLPLTDQEVRNAVYSGPVIKVIADMAKSDKFRQATQGRIESKRKTDMDFVSRFVAFYYLGWRNYNPNLDMFINSALNKLNEEHNQTVYNRISDDFNTSMSLAIQIFGNRAFRKQQSIDERRRPMNKAYFEVLSVVLAQLDKKEQFALVDRPELLNLNLCTAMKDSMSYRNSFSGGTGSISSVNIRYSWVEKIVKATLEDKLIAINDDNQITTD